jgi:hypothetical protein
MVVANDASIRCDHVADLIEVVEGRLLAGVLHVSGALPDGFEPFDVAFRFEFHDEPDGRTRLELWHEVGGPRAAQGAQESFTKLDAVLAARA